MLEGSEGFVEVDGASEVDGDDIENWERSSARTTLAGVPLVLFCRRRLLESQISRDLF